MMGRHHHRTSSSYTSRQTVKALALPPFVRFGCLILAVASLSFSFFVWVTNREAHDLGGLRQRLARKGGASDHRIAIIIPFIGQGATALPSYLEIFCTAAAGASGLVDFLLIHNGVLDGVHPPPEASSASSSSSSSLPSSICPPNVIFLSLGSTEAFARALVRVLDRKPEEDLAIGSPPSRDKMAHLLTQHVLKYPYVLVEFKPALGHIFESFLEGYTHWGYSDLDILFGDLERWITHDELNDFDIVTYGFGDQDRIYLRGQFTFHRNDPNTINQLWRRCSYLSDMDQRFARVLAGEESLHFESAEGCYSAAVLENNEIAIKYAVKAFTDVEGKDTAHSHGLFVAMGKNQDKTILYKAGKDNPRSLGTVADNWFEARGSTYANSRILLYKEVGDRKRIPMVEKKDAKCMFWAQKHYQSRLCLDNVSSSDNVYWINGQLYKQKYELVSLPGGIITAPFFHFQEWKRYYRPGQLGGFHRNGPARTFVLSKEGILPILPLTSGRTGLLSLPGTKNNMEVVPSPLGLKPFQWNGVLNDDRKQLPRQYYCLRSFPRKRSPLTTDCKLLTSWHDKDIVEVLSGAPAWSKVDMEMEVTLALTLQINQEHLDSPTVIGGLLNLLSLYVDRWQGQPSIIVIHVAGGNLQLASVLRKEFGSGSDGLDTCLVAVLFSTKPDAVSRKALLNMAMDAAPTRWVLGGFELERGIIMSQDTAYIAHRTAHLQKELPGTVHVMPQFGLVHGEHDFTIPALELSHLDGNLKSLAKLEEGFCEGDRTKVSSQEWGVFGEVETLWWQSTRRLTKGKAAAIDEENVEREAIALEEIQNSIIGLLTEEQHFNLYATDVSPILLFDNLGPRTGMITTEMVREVEEFGGRLCYNPIRLAQMATLGYSVNVLAGAFAISTPATRDVIGNHESAALGASRCDGCFFFSEEQNDEEILEDISRDERKRPAKIAILWEQATNLLNGHA